MTDPALQQAIDNNAAWCDAVCRAAGGDTRFEPGLWCNGVVSPPCYPSVITLDDGIGAADVARAMGRVRPPPGGAVELGVKDSHARLDLAPLGFTAVFEGRWFWRDPAAPEGPPARLRWQVVDTVAGLRAWEQAWWPGEPRTAPHPDLYGPALLGIAHIAFLAGHDGPHLRAGAAATVTGGVVGLSCEFFHGPGPEAQRRELRSVVAQRFPGHAIVGYDGLDEMAALRDAGFRELGPLRVWVGRPGP